MQLGLPLVIPSERRLSPVESLCDGLGCTFEEVVQAIECGIVPYAFDLRLTTQEEISDADERSARAPRREIRIWRPVVETLIKSCGRDSGPNPPDGIDGVIRYLVPTARDLRTPEIERWWCVSHPHVHRLVTAGQLREQGRRAAARGPSSFALVDRESAAQFLRSRALSQLR